MWLEYKYLICSFDVILRAQSACLKVDNNTATEIYSTILMIFLHILRKHYVNSDTQICEVQSSVDVMIIVQVTK